MPAKQPFTKIALSLPDQVKLLQARGMEIPDVSRAEHYLAFIGYYRLGGYFRHFQIDEQFVPGITFDDVLDLYIFDRKIRLQMFDALERIEIAVRAVINNAGSLDAGPFWLTDANNFDYGRHGQVIAEIKKVLGDDAENHHQHMFISHFYRTYSDPYPPSWMLMECLSLGSVSRIYKVMKGILRQQVAARFSLQHDVLESWLHSVTYSRNVCAHHSRCWKRIFTIIPKVPKAYRSNIPQQSANRLYMQCWIAQHFLSKIADGSKWPEKLQALILEKPNIELAEMGFPTNWQDEPFWGLKKPQAGARSRP